MAEPGVSREQVLAFRAAAQSLDRRRPAAELLGVAGLGRYPSWIHVDTRRSGRARWTG